MYFVFSGFFFKVCFILLYDLKILNYSICRCQKMLGLLAKVYIVQNHFSVYLCFSTSVFRFVSFLLVLKLKQL